MRPHRGAVVLYLFFATSVGIFLGTIARLMPQLGLLFMLVALPLHMLSGSDTPLESMPNWLQTIMQASPRRTPSPSPRRSSIEVPGLIGGRPR